MKSTFETSLIWAAAIILTATVAFAAAQAAQGPALPDGPGKAILERACASCHALDPVTSSNLATREDYAEMVSAMIGAGAIVSKQEEPVLVDYLFAAFGQKPKTAAASSDDAAVKKLVEAACTSCHGLEGMANHVYDKPDDYANLVKGMIDYGATIPSDQVPAVVQYLFKTYGKK